MVFLRNFSFCLAVLIGIVNSLPNLHRSDAKDNEYYCPNENTIIEIHPHPNCEYYYKVQSGFTYEVKCPAETHFNKITSCCEDYAHAKCIYGKAPIRPDAISETPDVPLPPPIDDMLDSYICLEGHKEGSFYAHPNCARFYENQRGTVYEMTCPTGLQWNRYDNCCDAPGASNCIFGMAPHRPSAVTM